MPEIITVNTKAEYDEAAGLFREYAIWLNIDLGFQHFENELHELPKMYAPPAGVILLSKEGENQYSGCVAVRPIDRTTAELKRMFIRAENREQGVATLLLQHALEFAAVAGYKKIRLDTLARMKPAIALYEKAGFYRIEPYYFNPQESACFFEKLL